MRMTPELQLLGAYWGVRNALTAGSDPAQVPADRPTGEEGEATDALSYFCAGLRLTFDTGDNLAAFDEFAHGLREEAKALRHDAAALARQEEELQLVRARIAQTATDST